MRVRILAVLSLLTLVAMARPAVAGGGGHGACAGFTRGTAISIEDNCFQGTAHIVGPGSTVTVTNHGQISHDLTAADGSFSSGLLGPGERFAFTVDKGGAIPFYCTIHGSATGSGMAGVLFVEESAAQAHATTARFGQEATSAAPAATTAVNDSAPSYLAGGALLLSILALVIAVPLVRLPRRKRRAVHQT